VDLFAFARALRQVHDRGLVHKDIKPANVLVNVRDGGVWLTGFVFSSLVPRERPNPQAPEMIAGTLAYMAPEQILEGDILSLEARRVSNIAGMDRAVDGRADLYSLGVVLYQMATGRMPFEGSTPAETIARILEAQPDAMARFNYELPQELERIVRKCLEKDRERRYQSARELMVDLRGLLREREAAPVELRTRLGEREGNAGLQLARAR